MSGWGDPDQYGAAVARRESLAMRSGRGMNPYAKQADCVVFQGVPRGAINADWCLQKWSESA